MGAISKILPSPSSATPISVIELGNALLSALRTTRWRCGQHSTTFGLAVSGGVDSMALAALCSQLQKTPYQNIRSELQLGHSQYAIDVLRNIRFKAFVVDHGVREGSDAEARGVSKVLEERDIPTQILKIDWAGFEKPADLPNFESLARKYRFQALGKACRDLGINSLLLAHHQDDQAETVMMRLIAGHRMPGLIGIKASTEMPECYGIHGVHESGGLDISAEGGSQKLPSTSISSAESFLPKPRYRSRSLQPLESEIGGVRVYRPLLHFNKENLVATCQTEKMKWFEDNTNKDPSLTKRNAVRHMFKYHALPPALSKPALLRLSRSIQAKHNLMLEVANSWLAECHIKSFETRTGLLRICFADLEHYIMSPRSLPQRDSQYAAALLLRRIIMLVTPAEHVNISSMPGAVERIFPALFSDHESPPPTAFTVAGVQFTPLVRPMSQERTSPMTSGVKRHEWFISRQSYFSAITKHPTIYAPAPQGLSAEPPWLPWTLYDGRFWFRIQNLLPSMIAIRPFRQDDMMDFKRYISKADRDKCRSLWKNLAPGSVRWTLPAIIVQEKAGKERVVALPTLDMAVPDIMKMVRWQVRYKKIDVENVM